MSEYQRYEFMAIDRPLTQKQLDAVDRLSSHIEASSTHAIVEYNYGDFKHDPIEVLREFFDGFLYWANWGSPRLALRFPHGVLPANLIKDYDFDEFVTFTKHSDYDILNIEFPEMESPDEWTEYELGSMIPIRDELMEGDLRSLYIAWLVVQETVGIEDEEDEEYDTTLSIPPVPPGFKKLTAAQQALADFLQVTPELLVAAAQHGEAGTKAAKDDFATWIERLPQERRNDYLQRLAINEPGLSRQLVRELRELGRGKTTAAPPMGERVSYPTLLAESKALKARLERERREEEQRAHERQMKYVYDHQEEYWSEIDQAAARKNSSGYDEALRMLIELREAMAHFNEDPKFQARFQTWIRDYLRRPALIDRLKARKFTIPRI